MADLHKDSVLYQYLLTKRGGTAYRELTYSDGVPTAVKDVWDSLYLLNNKYSRDEISYQEAEAQLRKLEIEINSVWPTGSKGVNEHGK